MTRISRVAHLVPLVRFPAPQRTYVLAADTPELRVEWMTALRASIAYYATYPRLQRTAGLRDCRRRERGTR